MRLITRANLDGIFCAVFITRMEKIDQVVFANPQDIGDGTVAIQKGDIIANLPFHPNAEYWFNNHVAASGRLTPKGEIKGLTGFAPSAARLVYNFYDSPRLAKYEPLLWENDRIDNANLTIDDVLRPKDLVLLSYTLDPFMGLSAFHGYAFGIMMAIQNGSPIQGILDTSDVKGRVNRYMMDVEDFKQEMTSISHLEENVIVTDFRLQEVMPSGNRFIAFALFPDGNVQIGLSLHKDQTELRIRLGKSIFNRTCRVHLGELAGEFGGGGLDGAAGISLPVNAPDLEQKIQAILKRLKANA